MLPQVVLYSVASMVDWLRRVLIKRLLLLYLLHMTNIFVTFHYGLEKYLESLLKNLRLYMGLNLEEVVVLQQLLMQVYLLNFGVSMVIGHLLKAKNVI